MNTQKTIERIDQQIATLQRQKQAVIALGEKLADYPHEIDISAYGDYVDFNNLNRTETVALITHMKFGKWDKSPSAYEGKIDYVNQTAIPDVKLRIWGAEPPPSCKLVETEVEIPAQPARMEKRITLQCKEHELQAV